MSIINTIFGWFGLNSKKDGPSGAEAVRNAVEELQDFAERQFTVQLGEPDIIDNGGRYFNDPKVEIPVYNGPFSEQQHLVFDLPRTPDDETEQFNEMLSLLGLTFDTMDEMVGQEINARFVGGNLVVDWAEMEPPEDTDNGGAEDIEEVVEESENAANVEEKTITGETADA